MNEKRERGVEVRGQDWGYPTSASGAMKRAISVRT